MKKTKKLYEPPQIHSVKFMVDETLLATCKTSKNCQNNKNFPRFSARCRVRGS